MNNNATIEIRLPAKQKAAFDKKCRKCGTNMSEAIRVFIDFYNQHNKKDSKL